ncbi:MAG: 16S rRNA (guanine(527)-N(7))-methyltransferase RsmG [Candidatus Cloacimonadota bacterium]|nr:16S rRNA (guanine(527)-N(7))-methyltransferase RsmG [Candidatus Cloacimonadota bacterium]
MKKYFEEFIDNNFFPNRENIIKTFGRYLELLRVENRKINLVSRETTKREFWTLHFLDSILPVTHMNLKGKKVLDFGTGGGLPGIPLKIVEPEMQLYMLDSRRKKVLAVERIIKKLDLNQCFTIVSRLEELDSKYNGFFDAIVCRSVRIKPNFVKHLFRIMKDDGRIYLYKSRKLDDVKQFWNAKIIDVSHTAIGDRKIAEIKKK